MAPTEKKPRVLIAGDASDLAFRIGQAVQKNLMRKAIEHATNRKGDTVVVDDVEAAAIQLDLVAACRAAGVLSNASKGQTPSAA
jgi:hypothetical protein